MRAYFFGNMYLSSIQQGIQAGHAIAEMFVKYEHKAHEHDMLIDWAEHHKTMVLLNAGYSDEVLKLVTMFSDEHNHFPWAPFRESREALDGALTTVGIILPEEIYGAAKQLREGPGYLGNKAGTMTYNGYALSAFEFGLAQTLNNYGLAR